MEKRKIGVKTALPYTEAVAYLKALVRSLESGKIVVESGGEHIALTPGDQVEIEVEAKTGKGRQKFSLEIGWAEMGAADLKISDKEPAPAPKPDPKSDTEAAPELALAAAGEKTALPGAGEQAALPEAEADDKAGKKEKKDKKEKKIKQDKPERKDKPEKKAKPEKSKDKKEKKAKK